MPCYTRAAVRLVYAFVAEAAQFTSDGKLWVLGGDFVTISASAFPAVHPAMTLAVKLEAQPTECGREHQLRVVLLDADGAPLMPQLEAGFRPEVEPNQPHRPVGIGLALNFQTLTFTREGDYGFHILVDNLEMGVVPLYLLTQQPDIQPRAPGEDGPQVA